MYNNKFFATEEAAKAFRKQHGGVLLHVTPRSRDQEKLRSGDGRCVRRPWRGRRQGQDPVLRSLERKNIML